MMERPKLTDGEKQAIHRIVTRAEALYKRLGYRPDRVSLTLGMVACHKHVCPLDLTAMLNGPDSDFAHDIGGIMRHLDLDGLRMRDCFLPRYARLNHSVKVDA